MALRTLASKRTLTLARGLGFRHGGGGGAAPSGEHLRRHARGLVTFSLPDLPYDYGALEPAISSEIMKLHHQKHHQTYITNYNKALEQLEDAMAKGDASAVVGLQSAIKFNGGGKPYAPYPVFSLPLSLSCVFLVPGVGFYLGFRNRFDGRFLVAFIWFGFAIWNRI